MDIDACIAAYDWEDIDVHAQQGLRLSVSLLKCWADLTNGDCRERFHYGAWLYWPFSQLLGRWICLGNHSRTGRALLRGAGIIRARKN